MTGRLELVFHVQCQQLEIFFSYALFVREFAVAVFVPESRWHVERMRAEKCKRFNDMMTHNKLVSCSVCFAS